MNSDATVVVTENAQIVASTYSGYRIMQSRPDELKRHDISDEELTMLMSNESRTFEQDTFWVAIGAFVAALPGAISGFRAWQAAPATFGAVELVTCLICAAALVACIIMGIILYRRPGQTPASELAKAIRERTAREVG